MLADLLTIEENFGHLEGINLVFMGDARNNVANSLLVASAKMGLNFTVVAPKELWPEEKLVEECKLIAQNHNSKINMTEDPIEGTKNANVIYTDVWVSMGEPDEIWEKRIKLLKPYQVNNQIIENASNDVIFLHCLPSFHDLNTTIGKEIYEKFGLKEMEVTDEVFEGPQSRVFEEAENRLHTIKAVMLETMKK
jgi:ornithine carbamoyltransferase